jgi:hypothetical protein
LNYRENKTERNLPSSSSFLQKQESIYLPLLPVLQGQAWIPAGVYPALDAGRE